jgi:hypothetical protein
LRDYKPDTSNILVVTTMKTDDARTKKETIEKARMLSAQQREAYRRLRALRGKVDFVEGYDHKSLRRGK